MAVSWPATAVPAKENPAICVVGKASPWIWTFRNCMFSSWGFPWPTDSGTREVLVPGEHEGYIGSCRLDFHQVCKLVCVDSTFSSSERRVERGHPFFGC